MNNNIYETNSNRKKELINYFYDILIKLRPNIFLDVLKGYSNLLELLSEIKQKLSI